MTRHIQGKDGMGPEEYEQGCDQYGDQLHVGHLTMRVVLPLSWIASLACLGLFDARVAVADQSLSAEFPKTMNIFSSHGPKEQVETF